MFCVMTWTLACGAEAIWAIAKWPSLGRTCAQPCCPAPPPRGPGSKTCSTNLEVVEEGPASAPVQHPLGPDAILSTKGRDAARR